MRVNQVIFSGRLAREPEIKFIGEGNSLCNVTLVQNTRKKQGSEWVEGDPVFLDVTIWGRRGEAFAQYHKKGDMALVQGSLRQDVWEDKNGGGKRYKIRLNATEWHFASERREDGDGPQPSPSSSNDDTPF